LLPFNGFRCSPADNVPPAGHCSYKDEVDLFEDVRNVLFKNVVIRFYSEYPGIYPVNGGWDKNSGGQILITALCTRSQKSAGGCDLK
jgi:hypothetical protein